jgi:hypothetical protein
LNPRCIAVTKAGSPCSNRAVTGETVCLAHSDKHPELAKKAAAASVAARKASSERRKEELETAKLTLTERIRRVVARRADEFAEALVQRGIDEPNSQAAAMVLDRVEGRVPQGIEHTAPPTYTVEDLMRDLDALPETADRD